MGNPRHREAFALFSAQSGKLRSEYVVDCILKAKDESHLEEIVRRIITKALNSINLTNPTEKKTMVDLQPTESLSDLPDVLLSSLDEI